MEVWISWIPWLVLFQSTAILGLLRLGVRALGGPQRMGGAVRRSREVSITAPEVQEAARDRPGEWWRLLGVDGSGAIFPYLSHVAFEFLLG